jgi:protocatechuate 3,4-dioxygenase beta subunit
LVVGLSMPVSATAQQIQIFQGAGGEQIQLPGMLGGRPVKTGTGRILGRVIAAETGNALRRAQVRISGPDIGSRAALTDTEGRFEFRDLPAGRFNLQATKSGYVTVAYGQTRPFESGRPIELSDKQVLENADITMPRGSVIAGRILDEFGEPVPDAMVTALRQSWSNGRRRLMPAGGRTGQTNDLGQFRIYGLPPGDYYLSATLRSGAEMMAIEMMAGGPGAGPTGSNPASGYAPTYFPGTSNAAEAQRISLAIGQEASTDFALLPVRLARITGIVIGSEGKPLEGAMVTANSSARTGDVGLMMMGSSARTNKEGAFTLTGVAPGDYVLQARSMQVMTTSDAGGNTMVFTARLSSGGGDGESEFGVMPVTVGAEDVSNLVVITSRGGTATGRVIVEDGAKPPSLTTIRVSAGSTDVETPMPLGPTSGAVKADGAFEVKGVTGQRLFRVQNAPPGWTLKAVRLNDVDVTDTGVDFKAGESISGLEVVLTSRTTSITGGVTGSDGAPLKDYTVVIFSDDPAQWRLPMTRWVTGTRPDQEGRFKVQNLPPGTYYAVAVDYLPQGEWGDPELLERLHTKGKRFTLDEGSSQTLDLKISDMY